LNGTDILNTHRKEVKQMLKSGLSYRKIAKLLGVNHVTVKRFCDRNGWKSGFVRKKSFWEKLWFGGS
jgi:IS30 family transposase